jgi:ribosomal protein S18 acetylase RimI-like enzyme
MHETAALPRPRIRPVAPRDLAEVIRLDAVRTGTAQPAYWQRLFAEAGRRRRDRDDRIDRGRVGLVAEAAGEVAGFVFGEVRAFEFGSEPCGWILEVAVDPQQERRGIASALLAEACRRLRAAGVATIRTMVRRNDVPVLTFFRTNGFAGGPYVQLELDADTPPGREDR